MSVPPESEMVPTGPQQTVAIDVVAGDALELHIPAGDVVIEGGDVDEVTAALDIKCPEDSDRCAEWAAETAVVASREGDKVEVRVSEPAKMNASVEVRMTIPRDNPVSITMGYGNLEVLGVANHITVEMKAGDLFIDSPADAVRAVSMAARFGDVTLEEAHDEESGSRQYLVGARLDWLEGRGAYNVVAKLRYGNVHVRLH